LLCGVAAVDEPDSPRPGPTFLRTLALRYFRGYLNLKVLPLASARLETFFSSGWRHCPGADPITATSTGHQSLPRLASPPFAARTIVCVVFRAAKLSIDPTYSQKRRLLSPLSRLHFSRWSRDLSFLFSVFSARNPPFDTESCQGFGI